jgi:c-di-GMP-binding flagellar brake protein YcgR
MFVEKRKHQRLKIKLIARIECENKYSIEGKSRNISFGGIFFEPDTIADDRIQKGDICMLTLMLNQDDQNNSIPLDFQCKVVHVRKRGYGMQFLSIEGLEAYDHFEKMMVLNSDASESLMAELEKRPGLIVKEED